jgi:cation diffusion facilitator CzcD-associated flavoprotein CzcO
MQGEPQLPDIPGMKDFKGDLLIHSSAFKGASQSIGKNAIVVGAGNSGNDIAEEYCAGGANTTIVQRSSSLIVSQSTIRLALAACYREGGVSSISIISCIVTTEIYACYLYSI